MAKKLSFKKGKMSHEERLDEVKNNIDKIKVREEMAPRKKRIILTSVGAGLGLLAIGAFTATLIIASNKPEFPELAVPESNAEDYVAHKESIENHFDVETDGSKIIYNGSVGPVNFVSNYGVIYDDDVLGDMMQWFYHDVSWGPEISSLAGINFLSGVSRDPSGTVTLGYHTSSKDATTIIMSPDVMIMQNFGSSLNQSLMYSVLDDLSDVELSDFVDFLNSGTPDKDKLTFDDNHKPFLYRDIPNNVMYNNFMGKFANRSAINLPKHSWFYFRCWCKGYYVCWTTYFGNETSIWISCWCWCKKACYLRKLT